MMHRVELELALPNNEPVNRCRRRENTTQDHGRGYSLTKRRPTELWRTNMTDVRKETDSLGIVEVAADKLWGAQTQRSLEHFSIGTDLIPREMITAYAILKKAAANANRAGGRLRPEAHDLIVRV